MNDLPTRGQKEDQLQSWVDEGLAGVMMLQTWTNGRLITRFKTELDALLSPKLHKRGLFTPGGKGAIYSTATDCAKDGT